MAGCYECQHCGKCNMPENPIPSISMTCADCGHVVVAGESMTQCAVCGSTNLSFPLPEIGSLKK